MHAFPPARLRRQDDAFTLVEMLVSMAVLALLVVMIAQLFSSAVSLTTLGDKRIDADQQARVLFDRMAVDFARMVKRADVDYYLKQPAYPQLLGSQANPTGNDQIAFYSEVPGYYPTTGAQSPVSLVAYRVNSNAQSGNYAKVERLGKGLVWNGVSSSATPSGSPSDTPLPVLFLPVPLAVPLVSPLPSPMPTPPTPIPTPAWPQAGNSDVDPHGDYELIGPQIFRLEYYYLLKGQTVGGTSYPSTLSDTPWDTRIPGHLSVTGLQDVAAIAVAIAVIDPKSHVLATDAQLVKLAAKLKDFDPGDVDPATNSAAGRMEAKWETAIVTGIPELPSATSKAVRVYHHYFYLNLPQ